MSLDLVTLALAKKYADEKVSGGSHGKDGTSATHSWNGTVLTITSASGTSSADLKGDKGEQGIQGIPGEKGEKGDPGGVMSVNGITPDENGNVGVEVFVGDTQMIVDAVLAALPKAEGVQF